MAVEGGFGPATIDLAVAAVLVWVAVEDLRRFRIPNRAVAILAAGFVGLCLAAGRTGLLGAHGVFALICLALMLAAFAARMIGGGDAKLLTVALLWLGPENALVFALLLMSAVLLYAGGARLGLLPARRVGARMRIPFGPCIAASWLVAMGLQRALL